VHIIVLLIFSPTLFFSSQLAKLEKRNDVVVPSCDLSLFETASSGFIIFDSSHFVLVMMVNVSLVFTTQLLFVFFSCRAIIKT
jgi:hypothetical protein